MLIDFKNILLHKWTLCRFKLKYSNKTHFSDDSDEFTKADVIKGYMTGTTTINNALHENTYDLPLSQLNLPRTPKFVICDWRLTYTHNVQYNKPKEFTASSYTFFDFINSKCYYPTNTMWSHSESGNYEIVDTIRNFTDKTILYMHIESNDRYLIPTIDGYEDSNFSRDPMRVFWTAFV